MSKRGELAVELKHQGHNCAQAIACAYEDCVDLDRDTLYTLNQGFGGGFGGMDGHCGCLSGASVILSLKNENKAKTASEMRKVSNEFKVRNGTLVCKELKGLETGTVIRKCDDCVRDVAEFIEPFLEINE